MSSILYGFIHCFDASPEAQSYNQAILHSLPVTGAMISKPLFSLLPNSREHCYYGHLIQFSMYFKDFYAIDEDWLTQFERLLQRLYWDSSELIHTYTGERRTWNSTQTRECAQAQGLKIDSRQVFPSFHGLGPIVNLHDPVDDGH
nr:hypothetical protein FFPRI1PSEUD_27530 [Pseudomonas sp. FFPRI_1]